MRWRGNERYGLAPAPGGLALVQDLLNTRRSPQGTSGDLLSSVRSAQEWASAAIAEWAVAGGGRGRGVRLRAADVEELRAFRDQLVAVAGAGGEPLPAELRVVAGWEAGGRLVLEPAGTGWQVVAGAVLLEVHRAQLLDEWRRVKTCRSPICLAVFYDRSRNNSAVWHDVRACGNAINLRASRARAAARAGVARPRR
ncbi:CGNR zinc finger domain-containing protein [Amycolatopsis sp. NPDC050768]|uniref:CGNR zinc finger domain-containing protein n=1 Tax=Amycolatopsis sp. NPDC050768 TaxID=3154839 RepID=UPI0033D70DC4